MRNLLIHLLIGIITCSLFMNAAEAKRFGGGKSFGMSRSVSQFSRPANQFAPRAIPAATNQATSSAKKWLAPLAGFAAGGLLASLFMGHGIGGMGGGILSWILLGLAALLAWRFISRRFNPVSEPYQSNLQDVRFQNQNQYQQTAQETQGNIYPHPASYSPKATLLPADFEETAFLREMKSLFIRLQAAYDTKNLDDIREFTAPAVSAEIQLQFGERGTAENHTEIVSINAELLDVTVEAEATIATVHFTGWVREEKGAEPVAIKEMWHFTKKDSNQKWIVTGIQQA